MKQLVSIDGDFLRNVICEFRFDASVINAFIQGEIWTVLREESDLKMERPLQLPGVDVNGIIIETHNLNFKVKFADSSTVMGFDANRVWFSYMQVYPGWDTFKKNIEYVITLLQIHLPFIRYSRIGLRYINELDTSILYSSATSIVRLPGLITLQGAKLSLTADTPESLSVINVEQKNGISILDIDVGSKLNNPINWAVDKTDLLERLHDIEKRLFQTFTPEDLIATRNPVYKG